MARTTRDTEEKWETARAAEDKDKDKFRKLRVLLSPTVAGKCIIPGRSPW